MLNDFEDDVYNVILCGIRDEIRRYAEELNWDDMESSIREVLKQVSNDRDAMDWLYDSYMAMKKLLMR